jgi:hypothetical protein
MRTLPLPPNDPRRQTFLLKFVVGVLLFTAFILLVLPLRIPRPIRLILVSTELLAAGSIWVLAKARING